MATVNLSLDRKEIARKLDEAFFSACSGNDADFLIFRMELSNARKAGALHGIANRGNCMIAYGNTEEDDKKTYMHWVAMADGKNNDRIIRELHSNGWDINAEDEIGHTPLSLALITRKNCRVISTILECGAIIDYDSAKELMHILDIPKGMTPDRFIATYDNKKISLILNGRDNSKSRGIIPNMLRP